MRKLLSVSAGELGIVDYLLGMIAGNSALYAIGAAVSRTEVGWQLIALHSIGCLLAFAFGRALKGSRLLQADSYLYIGLLVFARLATPTINRLIPAGPFIEVFVTAGFLAFAITASSFVTWRDNTLMFQAVPGIAAFGLVGCYDTFRDSAYLFFIFLIAIATLFSRIHTRSMLGYAQRAASGESMPPLDRLQRLKAGPWRTMAGPSWALLSAGVIAVLSFAGAPLVRQSVQAVAGQVKLAVPITPQNPLSSGFFRQDITGIRVGTGPLPNLSDDPVMRIQMDRPRYLRTGVFVSYSGKGWNRRAPAPSTSSGITPEEWAKVPAVEEMRLARRIMKDRQQVPLAIEMMTRRGGVVPVPAESPSLDSFQVTPGEYGTWVLRGDIESIRTIYGRFFIANQAKTPSKAFTDLPDNLQDLLSTDGMSPEVIALARQAASSGKSDFERAELCRREIASRIVYDQQAAGTPSDRDPVQYALFESKRGYCDLYASSMVQMARAIGIPARYVTGFYPFDSDPDDSGRYIVRERHAHAWAELLFEDVGWVAFDATEGADEADGDGRSRGSIPKAWWQRKGNWLWMGLAVMAVVAVAWLLWRLQIRTRPDAVTKEFERQYVAFTEALRKASGAARQPSQTPEEYLEQVLPSLNGSASSALSIQGKFLAGMYGPNRPTEAEVQALKFEVSSFAKGVVRKR